MIIQFRKPGSSAIAYVHSMQSRQRENKIGEKKEFLREILKEVRVRGDM